MTYGRNDDCWENSKHFVQAYTRTQTYYDYYKLNYDQFTKLVNILEPYLRKQEFNYRMPISVERLSVCLR